jgi:Protein of unknown function (DUF429)
MNIYGLDFTSSPTSKKPITLATAIADGDRLQIERVDPLSSFEQFSGFLHSSGPWVAGIDFPFGQPRKLIVNMGWPSAWSDYVRLIAEMSRTAFINSMRDYQSGRPRGDIRHFREVDKRAGSCSPMQLDFVPVAQMFFEGAKRILDSPCSVQPFYTKNGNERVAAEAYPALVARKCVKRRSYKSDNKEKQTQEHKETRRDIVKAMLDTQTANSVLRQAFGLTIEMPDSLVQEAVQDGSGDKLDAMLCAVQSAWAYTRRDGDYGMKPGCDPCEGWIVDPGLL